MASVAIQSIRAHLAKYLDKIPSKTAMIQFFRGQELDLLPLIPCLIPPTLHNQIAAYSGATTDAPGYTLCKKCTRLHLDRGHSDCTWCAKVSWYRMAVYSAAICATTVCGMRIMSLGSAMWRETSELVSKTADIPGAAEAASSSDGTVVLVSKCGPTTSDGEVFLDWTTWSITPRPT
ncbi:unnamed protein product [Zymoseptoria tritici ST99CH_1A5]|uniref:Uncharacterized protein n=1 Tax=Zymoseptoria tritici ST99CH_1A5 TaxID=1276529 RepID=A0A1Y6M1N0_ZYMTR|nr:unnamed protein product [Zymoseptoria tritici ST99CH_1A5]